MIFTLNGKTFDNEDDFMTAVADILVTYDEELEEEYDNWLDANNGGTIHICGISYSPATLFKTVDKIAYENEKDNFFNNYLEKIVDEIKASKRQTIQLGDEKFYLQYEE